MRFIHADCEVNYSGRGDTILERYERIICIKSDNTVLVMSDKGMKPLNYMSGSSKPKIHETHDEDTNITTLYVESRKEYITITCHRIFSTWSPILPQDDPGLIHDGTEDQIQQWLLNNIHTILPLSCIAREFPTENGPVDLLVQSKEDPILAEVKRTAMSDSVHQLQRYLEGSEVQQGFIIAMDMRPSARKRAEKYNIPWVEIEKSDEVFIIKEKSSDFEY